MKIDLGILIADAKNRQYDFWPILYMSLSTTKMFHIQKAGQTQTDGHAHIYRDQIKKKIKRKKKVIFKP